MPHFYTCAPKLLDFLENWGEAQKCDIPALLREKGIPRRGRNFGHIFVDVTKGIGDGDGGGGKDKRGAHTFHSPFCFCVRVKNTGGREGKNTNSTASTHTHTHTHSLAAKTRDDGAKKGKRRVPFSYSEGGGRREGGGEKRKRELHRRRHCQNGIWRAGSGRTQLNSTHFIFATLFAAVGQKRLLVITQSRIK